MYRNDAGRFTDIAGELGLADTRRSVGAVWFDYDEDGDLDLYAGNMDGDANGLFRNDSGRFTDVAEIAGVAWGGRAPKDPANGTVRPCAADVNGDGAFDLFTANYGPLGLFLNRKGVFRDVSSDWQIAIDSRYDACAFSDIDHDGRLDVYVNGTVTGGVSYRDHIFRNTGTRFEDVTPDNVRALQADHGVQWADFDRDGDEDLALTGSRPDGMHSLLRNLLPAPSARQALQIRVVDGRGRATLAGAEVRIYEPGTRTLLGARLVDTGSGYDAQNEMPVHFGVAGRSRVDVEVIYPAGKSRKPVRRTGVRIPGDRFEVLTIQVDR
jgi:FG-GAP-like repeat/ASPIC and UnbV